MAGMVARFWPVECACGFTGKLWGWEYALPLDCPTCGAKTTLSDNRTNQAHGIITDDIPGGLDVPNAICNPDGSPKRYYSKSSIRKAANDAGWTIAGETPKIERTRWV